MVDTVFPKTSLLYRRELRQYNKPTSEPLFCWDDKIFSVYTHLIKIIDVVKFSREKKKTFKSMKKLQDEMEILPVLGVVT